MNRGDIDWMEWANKVRERADRDGCDVHEAFGVVKMPRSAWDEIVRPVQLGLPSLAGKTERTMKAQRADAQRSYEAMRTHVCRLAASLVRFDICVERRIAV